MSARNRRDLENRELESLAQCLPLATAITFQLDKASIVRLTSAYLALRNVFPPQNSNGEIEKIAIGSFLLQTLDGFVLILDSTGKMMYVSETASVHLGLSQLYNDEIERMFFIRLKCVLPKRNAGIIYNGYKTISCWGYSKICHDGEKITNMGLLAVGYMLTRSGVTELKLSSSTFMFRARLDLNIIFVDSRVTALTGFGASSLLDTSLYQMVLLEDAHTIEKAHKILLHKNQSTTGYYRLLHRIRGYVWAQSQFCIVPMLRATVTHCIVAVTEIFSKREGDMTLAILQLDAEGDIPGSTLGEYSNLFYKGAPTSASLYLDCNDAQILPDR
ncbi:Single-minded [Dirofilaria immitis]